MYNCLLHPVTFVPIQNGFYPSKWCGWIST